MKPGDPAKTWERVERALEYYEDNVSPVTWFGNAFRGREGVHVLLRLAFLFGALQLTFANDSGWCVYLVGGVSGALLLDILLANTSVAIVSRRPANALCSITLTFLSFLSIAVAFAVFYAMIRMGFDPALTSALRALYFSAVTMTTLGYGDIKPLPDFPAAHWLVVIELAVSVYFLTILVARVMAWHGEPRK